MDPYGNSFLQLLTLISPLIESPTAARDSSCLVAQSEREARKQVVVASCFQVSSRMFLVSEDSPDIFSQLMLRNPFAFIGTLSLLSIDGFLFYHNSPRAPSLQVCFCVVRWQKDSSSMDQRVYGRRGWLVLAWAFRRNWKTEVRSGGG